MPVTSVQLASGPGPDRGSTFGRVDPMTVTGSLPSGGPPVPGLPTFKPADLRSASRLARRRSDANI